MRALAMALLLLAGCASVPRAPQDPVWAFEMSYTSGLRQIIYSNDSFRCEGNKMAMLRQAPSQRPSAVTQCRVARIFDVDAALADWPQRPPSAHVYWMWGASRDGSGLLFGSQEGCQRTEAFLWRTNGSNCGAVVIQFADEPGAAFGAGFNGPDAPK
jgi:hypothetical protein